MELPMHGPPSGGGSKMQNQEQPRKRHIEEMHQQVAALRASETECRQANESLRGEQGSLRRLLELQERDRRLIAFELHDGLAHMLASGLMQLQTFAQLSDWNSKEARQALDAAIQSLNDGMLETRQLARVIHEDVRRPCK